MVLPGLQIGGIETIKTTLLSGFHALPYLLIIIVTFLGGVTGNLGLGILSLGQIFAVPLLQNLLYLLRNNSFASDQLRLGPVPKLEPYCSLVPDVTKKDIFSSPVISYWYAQVCFFFGFLLTNAYAVYTLEADPKANPATVEKRKAQAMTSFVITFVVFVGLIGAYYLVNGSNKCETPGSFVLGFLVFGGAGVGWFLLDLMCGIKQGDIFGVASKIHTIHAGTSLPEVCVPLKTKSCPT